MSGLLFLNPVPRHVSADQPAVVKPLRASILTAAKEGRDRNIPLEEYYEQCLSWYEPRDTVYIVRVAPVDDKGRPFGPLSTLTLLKQYVIYNLLDRFEVIQADKVGQRHRFDHFYEPKAFNDTDFLYVPNNEHCWNIVVLKAQKR